MKLAKRLVELAVDRSQPTPERGGLSAQDASAAVVCSCGSIDRKMRGYWINLILPLVKRALEKQKREKRKRELEIERVRMKKPGYQFRLPF